MKEIPTKNMVEELKRRLAVQSIWVNPYKDFEIVVDGESVDTEIKQGACHILIIWD